MRVLVTGAAGFIGSHLVEFLLAHGHDVVGVDCFRPHYDVEARQHNLAEVQESPFAAQRFSFFTEDLVTTDLGPLLEGTSAVFHLAGRPGVRDSWGSSFSSYLHDNIFVTQRIAEGMLEFGVPRIVFASSSSVYGELGDRVKAGEHDEPRPLSPYGVTKLAAERLLLSYQDCFGIDVVALRYFTIYGPRQRNDMAIQKFIQAGLRKEKIFVYGDGTQQRALTFVEDCVRATIAGLSLPPAVYNVAGEKVVSLHQILDVIDAALPEPLQRVYSARQAGDVSATVADTSRLQASGFAAVVPFEEGIAQQVATEKKHFALLRERA